MNKVLKLLLLIFLVSITGILLLYIAAWFTPLKLDEKKENITIYDINNNIIYESNFKKNMNWTNYNDIPQLIIKTTIEVEDKRFNMHFGFDPLRITKAMINNIKHGQIIEGGSSITQQYAKNLFLTNEQTISRKLEEMYYASALEMQYSKEEILEGYLNTLYYGHNIYGITSAAKYFFNKELKDLDINETAMLIAIPNGPALYSPYINETNAIKRTNLVLNIMHENNLINDQAYNKSKEYKYIYNKDHTNNTSAEYYIESTIAELRTLNIDTTNIKIYTYYNPEVQEILSTSITEHIKINEELETAGIIVQPYTGNILAINGGKDYTISQYNRATNSKRQVASTIKPLLYYCSLLQGFNPSSVFLSEPTTFKYGNNLSYSVSNYNDSYPYKDISMINAISLSDNVYAVKMHFFLGFDTLNNALKDFKISNTQEVPSLALGSVNMSIYDLSSIYNTFASEGLYIKPSFIKNIIQEDKTIYERNTKTSRLLEQDETLVLSSMLTSTYDIKNTSNANPTLLGYSPKAKVAVKSGTSDVDSLIAGYNPEYTVVIWDGYDDNRNLEKKYYSIDKLIFKDVFNKLYKDKESYWYEMTPNIIEKIVDPISGKESTNGSKYWYIKES
ncbi:MAG: transglycosylase domain-containing protein [Erysipelotrichaceae bacterium]